jgi:hypothetical protein
LERVNIYLGGLDAAPLVSTNADADGAFTITPRLPQAAYDSQEVFASGQNSGKLGVAHIPVSPERP